MPFIGETIALIVAISWTATALFADEASHRLGSLALILIRMILSLTMLTLLLWVSTGTPFPSFASGSAWLWLALSGVVGYVCCGSMPDSVMPNGVTKMVDVFLVRPNLRGLLFPKGLMCGCR